MGMNQRSPLPSGLDDLSLATEFSKFFGNKVTKLRNEIDAQTQGEFSQQYLNIDWTFVTEQHFEFCDVTDEEVVGFVKKLNKTNCNLDVIDVKKAYTLFEDLSYY
jgi:hypothetical protein